MLIESLCAGHGAEGNAIFSSLFEICSAYGNVGLSIGSPNKVRNLLPFLSLYICISAFLCLSLSLSLFKFVYGGAIFIAACAMCILVCMCSCVRGAQTNASFAADWCLLSKLVLLAIMITGRTRELPSAVDGALELASGQVADAQESILLLVLQA